MQIAVFTIVMTDALYKITISKNLMVAISTKVLNTGVPLGMAWAMVFTGPTNV